MQESQSWHTCTDATDPSAFMFRSVYTAISAYSSTPVQQLKSLHIDWEAIAGDHSVRPPRDLHADIEENRWLWATWCVMRVVRDYPREEQRIFHLYFVGETGTNINRRERLGISQIATKLGIPRKRISRLLWRMVDEVEAELIRRGLLESTEVAAQRAA